MTETTEVERLRAAIAAVRARCAARIADNPRGDLTPTWILVKDVLTEIDKHAPDGTTKPTNAVNANTHTVSAPN